MLPREFAECVYIYMALRRRGIDHHRALHHKVCKSFHVLGSSLISVCAEKALCAWLSVMFRSLCAHQKDNFAHRFVKSSAVKALSARRALVVYASFHWSSWNFLTSLAVGFYHPRRNCWYSVLDAFSHGELRTLIISVYAHLETSFRDSFWIMSLFWTSRASERSEFASENFPLAVSGQFVSIIRD